MEMLFVKRKHAMAPIVAIGMLVVLTALLLVFLALQTHALVWSGHWSLQAMSHFHAATTWYGSHALQAMYGGHVATAFMNSHAKTAFGSMHAAYGSMH